MEEFNLDKTFLVTTSCGSTVSQIIWLLLKEREDGNNCTYYFITHYYCNFNR